MKRVYDQIKLIDFPARCSPISVPCNVNQVLQNVIYWVFIYEYKRTVLDGLR